jgi:hypothetical protein
MNSKWYKGIPSKDKEAKEARTKEVMSFSRAFEELDDLLTFEVSVADYNTASWSHKQADQNGYNRAIREVKDLIKLK